MLRDTSAARLLILFAPIENPPIVPESADILPINLPVISALTQWKYPVFPFRIMFATPFVDCCDFITPPLNINPATLAPSENNVSVAIFTSLFIASQLSSPLADVGASVTVEP